MVTYVQDQFRAFLVEESRVKRNAKFLDPRVHAVLYFIPPTGHGCVLMASAPCVPCAADCALTSAGLYPEHPFPRVLLRLGELDIQLMRSLCPYANIIPVVAKADTMGQTELQSFKKQVCPLGLLRRRRARRCDINARLAHRPHGRRANLVRPRA